VPSLSSHASSPPSSLCTLQRYPVDTGGQAGMTPLAAPSSTRGRAEGGLPAVARRGGARTPGGGLRRASSSRRRMAAALSMGWRIVAAPTLAGNVSSRRRRLLSPATAPEPELDLAGTRLLFHFVFRDSMAFLFGIQGVVCKKTGLVCCFNY
jgi:hypothetical protein